MNFNVYKCSFKGDYFIKIASVDYIENKLKNNYQEKSDLEKYLQKDDPKGYNDYFAELYDKSKDSNNFYESISYEETLKEDVTIFNDKISHLKFNNATFNNAKLDAEYFSNLYLIKKMHVNGASKGVIDLIKYVNLEIAYILKWSDKIVFKNNNNNFKSLIVWYYNPKSKSLNDLLGELESIEYLEFNLTNIENLEGIERLKNLKTIKINYGRNLKCISSLNSNKKLEHIYMNNCKKIEDFDLLESREGLKKENLRLPG